MKKDSQLSISKESSLPFPPPSHPERIFSVSGTWLPPVPMRLVKVWQMPSSLILIRLSVGLNSTATDDPSPPVSPTPA